MTVHSTNTFGRQRSLWRTDVRSIVGSVLFGVLMVLIVGLGDRVDASLTGGALPIFGGTTWAITMALSALLFGLPGAIIAGEIQALMDLALGVPLAPAFFAANAAGPLVFALVAHCWPPRSRLHHLLALVPAVLLGNLCVAAFLHFAFRLPLAVIVPSVGGVVVVSTIVAALCVPSLADAIGRSRTLAR